MNPTLSIHGRLYARCLSLWHRVDHRPLHAFFALRCVAQSMDYGALEQLFNEPVTTSVDGSPERVSDVPATMEIITAEEIRRSGAKDIPGVLRHVGGVDTMEWGNDNMDVSVRGYDQALSERLLVLVDGRQVYADHYGYTPWSTVPVELSQIRQIEIIKGPSSALFGFNAVGGVINIITYNPLYDEVNSRQFSAGTQNTTAGTMTATHKLGRPCGSPDRGRRRSRSATSRHRSPPPRSPVRGCGNIAANSTSAAWFISIRRYCSKPRRAARRRRLNEMGADYEHP